MATHVVLVGKEEAEDTGDGLYTFPSVEPGEYRLYVLGDYGMVSDSKLSINDSMAVVRSEVMICTCIETQLTTFKGVVTRPDGKAAAGARVAVEDLFIETTADKKGRYELAVPPGEWELRATLGKAAAAEAIKAVAPDAGEGGYPQEKTVDLRLVLEK